MIAVLVGTRPEIIKMAPVLRSLQKKNIPHIFIHSGQHYSFEMDAQIIKDLKLRAPDYNLGVGSASHAVQTGLIMTEVEKICLKEKPTIILVHGDTNTTLAGALAAKKLNIKVAHVEAGLRSFDYKMPEEINRILVDRISDILFAPTFGAKANLLKEGIMGKQIVVTGNTIVDALQEHLPLAEKSAILTNLKIKKNTYILVTAHRAETIDGEKNLKKLIDLLRYASEKLDKKIIWPLHPRTKKSLENFKIKLPNDFLIINPVGYVGMLVLLGNAYLVLTDSGGIQEEAYILKKRLMTLRDSTERPETMSANFLIHLDKNKFDRSWDNYLNKKIEWNKNFGNGDAGEIITDVLDLYPNLLDSECKKSACVVGLGYIGLPTALLIAKSGLKTIGFDLDQKKIKSLQKNKLYFEEKELRELFDEAREQEIEFTDQIKRADIFIIAVPTPQNKGKADLKYVKSALSLIKTVFKDGDLIIIESTVGPLDCAQVIIPQIEKWGKKFLFSHCPERAIPGNTLFEMVNNDRIIGGMNDESSQATQELYTQFVKGDIFITNPTTAATCKVMENTYRAVNIALANEFALLGEKLNFNAWEAIELSNKHPRVNIHNPGPGVGGHCIPIDPWFFVGIKKTPLIQLALEINEKMPIRVARKIDELILRHDLKKPKIAILGYAYKKNVDDSRETPTQVLAELLRKKYEVFITDSQIKNKEFFKLDAVLLNSDLAILMTDHDEYKKIRFKKYPNLKFVYDTRNLFRKENFLKSLTKLYKLGKS